jgi:glycosyltransferase involved in cell wall biosynthesis
MRIAQVAPLTESVPPQLYGGTERVVSYLTEGLVAAGHDVTLFASGDSRTSARLLAPCPRALRLEGCADPLAQHLFLLEQVFRRAEEFDVVHFHVHYLHFPITRRQPITHVTTMHGRLDLPDLIPLHREFREMPTVSISNAQREPLPGINWRGTVYHGLPLDLYDFESKPGDYLAFLGRISPEKRVDRAIEIAGRAGMKLKIAAKIDAVDQDYFDHSIRPLMDQPHVEYLGEIGETAKAEFLGGAHALLFPIDWPEPFGLAMIEALACGTPVVAFRGGSVQEVLSDGVSGFVCDDIAEAVAAVERVDGLSRSECRAEFERRFSVTRMVSDYLRIYETLVEEGACHGRDHASGAPRRQPVRDSRHSAASG